jgi:aminopeptidase N
MDVRHVFAHEIAHQYWGIVVKMPSPQEQWITESFADYCAALFERDYKGKSYYEKHVATWLDKAERTAPKAPIPLANEVHEKDAADRFYTRTNLLYAKGPMLLYSLHQNLGEQAFLTWMKSIQTNFRWKFATTRQLFDLLGFITKRNFMPFYEEYYWGLPMPPKKF